MKAPSRTEFQTLTKREHEIIGWIADGRSNHEVGRLLGISRRTVEKHVENILRKLDKENRTAAAMAWMRQEQI